MMLCLCLRALLFNSSVLQSAKDMEVECFVPGKNLPTILTIWRPLTSNPSRRRTSSCSKSEKSSSPPRPPAQSSKSLSGTSCTELWVEVRPKERGSTTKSEANTMSDCSPFAPPPLKAFWLLASTSKPTDASWPDIVAMPQTSLNLKLALYNSSYSMPNRTNRNNLDIGHLKNAAKKVRSNFLNSDSKAPRQHAIHNFTKRYKRPREAYEALTYPATLLRGK